MASTLHTPAATAETLPAPAHFEALFAAIRRLSPDSELYGLAKIGEYLAHDRRSRLEGRRNEALAAMEEAAVAAVKGGRHD